MILETINNNLSKKLNINQWKNTSNAIEWFRNIENKQAKKFCMFDNLAAIGNLIGTCACDDVIIAGDLNIDFNRKNGYAKRLRRFLEEEELA